MDNLLDFNHLSQVFIVCGKTDLRKGIDGLAAVIKEEYELNPFAPALFLFCGTRRDRFEALYWEGDGFLLLYKRFENGYLQWPRNRDEILELTTKQLRWLLAGMSVESTVRPAQPGSFY